MPIERTPADWLRPALVTLGLLIVFRLGTFIPVPGLQTEVLATMFRGNNAFPGAVERVSIFALGLVPILTAMLIAALVRALFLGFEGGPQATPPNQATERKVLIGALLLAAFQGFGIAYALEGVTNLVTSRGWQFQVVAVMTLVASTALIKWLADQITRAGLVNGVWALLACAAVADLPRTALLLLQLPSYQQPLLQFGVPAAVCLGVVAAVVVMARARYRQEAAGGTALAVALEGVAILHGSPWLLGIILAPFFYSGAGGGDTVTTLSLLASSVAYGLGYGVAVVVVTAQCASIIGRAAGGSGASPNWPADWLLLTLVSVLFLLVVDILPTVLISNLALYVYAGSAITVLVALVAIKVLETIGVNPERVTGATTTDEV